MFFDSKVSLEQLFPYLSHFMIWFCLFSFLNLCCIVIQIRAWPPINVFLSNTEVLCLFLSFTFFTLLASHTLYEGYGMKRIEKYSIAVCDSGTFFWQLVTSVLSE